MTKSRAQHNTFKDAYVHEMSVSVTFGAPCLGTILGALSGSSKYVLFFIAFGAHVLQTTLHSGLGASSFRAGLPLGLYAFWSPSQQTPPPKDSRTVRARPDARRQGRHMSVPQALVGPRRGYFQTSS